MNDLSSAHILALERVTALTWAASVLEVIDVARKITGWDFKVTLTDLRSGDTGRFQ